MKRIGKILAALVLVSGLFGADAALAFGHHGGHWGGWHGGWGGWGWGYPYYYYPYEYPPPPALSPYCATATHVCVLRHPHDIGSACSCRGVSGVISPPPQ